MQKTILSLRISKQFLGLFFLVWLGSFPIIFFLSIPFFLKIILFLLVASYGLKIIYQHVLLKSKNSIVRLQHDENGWQLNTPQKTISAQLAGDSTITFLVSILRFTVEKKRLKYSCIVWRDSLEGDHYRQLKMAVYWRSPAK